MATGIISTVIMIFPGLTSAGAGLEVARFVTLVRAEWSIAKGVTELSHSAVPRRYSLQETPGTPTSPGTENAERQTQSAFLSPPTSDAV
jgi:hypothetical protein